jgi:hypothetical protein
LILVLSGKAWTRTTGKTIGAVVGVYFIIFISAVAINIAYPNALSIPSATTSERPSKAENAAATSANDGEKSATSEPKTGSPAEAMAIASQVAPVPSTASSQEAGPPVGHTAQEFASKLERFKDEYLAAPNQIKMSQVFNESRAFEDRFFAETDHRVTDWEGWVENLETNHGGTRLSLRVAIGKRNGSNVKFHQGYAIVDRIKSGTQVYADAGTLREGGCVLFSGEIKGRDKGKELSLTEKGSMLAPEYRIVFSSLKACADSARVPEPAVPSSALAHATLDPIGTQKQWANVLVTLKEASVTGKTANLALLMQNLSDKEEPISSLVYFEALSEEGDKGEMDWVRSKCDGTIPPKGVFKCKLSYKFEKSPKEISVRVGAGVLADTVYFRFQGMK